MIHGSMKSVPFARLIASLCLLAVLLSGCSMRSTGTVDYAASKSTTRPKKFAWLEPPSPTAMPAPGLADSSGDERAPWKSVIGAALKSRSYQEVPAADAEFLVAFHLSSGSADTVAYLNQFRGYPASQVFNGPRGKVKSLVKDYTNGLGEPGMLIIDAVVPKETRFLWRGWARTQLRPGTPANWDEAASSAAVSIALARIPKP